MEVSKTLLIYLFMSLVCMNLQSVFYPQVTEKKKEVVSDQHFRFTRKDR